MSIDFQPIYNHALRWRDFIIEMFFPEECLACGREGEWLCRACARSIKINARQVCSGCNKLSDYGKFCNGCRKDRVIKGILVASSYDDPVVGGAIKSFKYHLVRELSSDLGEVLAIFLRDIMDMYKLAPGKSPGIFKDMEKAVFIPIPLHPRRERFRGFNQSALLVEALAGRFNLEADFSGLVRIKYSKPQAKLKPRKRLENIKDSFSWIGGDLKGRNVILIDDVATTGSTLNEAAKVLKRAGAREVWGIVVARG